jgi:hypothetical protein
VEACCEAAMVCRMTGRSFSKLIGLKEVLDFDVSSLDLSLR